MPNNNKNIHLHNVNRKENVLCFLEIAQGNTNDNDKLDII